MSVAFICIVWILIVILLLVSTQDIYSKPTRNFALAYFMKENKCFPPSGDLYEIMDMYFQTCSMEINTEALSVMGATLANGGT